MVALIACVIREMSKDSKDSVEVSEYEAIFAAWSYVMKSRKALFDYLNLHGDEA